MEITNLDLQNQINSMKTTILQTVFPVGSIYVSFKEIGSPKNVLGFGTWELIKDRFLLAAYSIEPESNRTGGSITHNHTLVAGTSGCTASAALDVGTENILYKKTTSGVSAPFTVNSKLEHSKIQGTNDDERKQGIGLVGVTGTGDNLPPYLTVYMWKRTA